MTIALGFMCMDGIILCADTQETVGSYLKRQQPKITIMGEHSSLNSNPCAVFASATEDGDLSDVLVDKIWTAMEAKRKGGLQKMIMAAEKELISQYNQRVPLYPTGIPGTSFLVGVWAAPDEFDLIKINGPNLKRNVRLDAIGCGAVLATYLTSRLLYPKSWLPQAVPVGIYMID